MLGAVVAPFAIVVARVVFSLMSYALSGLSVAMSGTPTPFAVPTNRLHGPRRTMSEGSLLAGRLPALRVLLLMLSGV